MSLSGKVEGEVEIKASAEKFFDIFRKKLHHVPNITPEKIHAAKVHEGDWENVGSVKHWDFTIGKFLLSFKFCLEIQLTKANL